MNSSKHTTPTEASGRSRLSQSWQAPPPLGSSSATSAPATFSTRAHPREQLPSFSGAPAYKYDTASEYMRAPPTTSGYPYISHNATPQGRKESQQRIDAIKSRSERKARSAKLPAEAPTMAGSSQPDQESHYSGEATPPLSASVPYDDASTVDEHELKTPISPQHSMLHDTAQAQEPKDKPRPRRRGTVRFEDVPDEVPASCSVKSDPPHSESDESTFIRRAFGQAQVDRIIYDFNTLVLSFKFPSNLDFMSPKDGELFPSLAYTPQNKSLLEQKQKLDGVLEKLDGVESHGDEEVRRVRKDAVERVAKALEILNQMQAMVWFNVSPHIFTGYSIADCLK